MQIEYRQFPAIAMCGLDYRNSSLQEREAYAFAPGRMEAFARKVRELSGGKALIVLSTCNRTELWLSGMGAEDSAADYFLQAGSELGLPSCLLTERRGSAAVSYIFELAGGMHSQVYGDFQILTQVRQAMDMARKWELSDAELDTLFRKAVEAGKRLRSEVQLSLKDASVPGRALELLEEGGMSWKACKAMVIGNGEMGRELAYKLLERGVETWMTLRTFRKGEVLLPRGCEVLPYDKRLERLGEFDAVFSCTWSPHYTIKRRDLEQLYSGGQAGKQPVLVDLAVPRDIEDAVADLPGIHLINMDSLGISPALPEAEIRQAKQILDELTRDYSLWWQARLAAPGISDISARLGRETVAKLTPQLRKWRSGSMDLDNLEAGIGRAAESSVRKLLYTLRDECSTEEWQKLLQALAKGADIM